MQGLTNAEDGLPFAQWFRKHADEDDEIDETDNTHLSNWVLKYGEDAASEVIRDLEIHSFSDINSSLLTSDMPSDRSVNGYRHGRR